MTQRRLTYLATLTAGLIAGFALKSCGPTPGPTPPPCRLIIVYESETLTPAQAEILTSKALHDYLDSTSLWYRIVDKDIDDENGMSPAALQTPIGACRGLALPRICTMRQDSTVETNLPLPQTVAETIDLIKLLAPAHP